MHEEPAAQQREPPPADSDRLPELLRPLFWDCDFEQVSWQEHHDYVIRRVLSEGTLDSIRWLRGRLDNATLRDWIVRHEGRGLSSRQLRFWEVILDLPAEKVNAWLDNEGRRLWEGRGRG
jgi:hypothetical protein